MVTKRLNFFQVDSPNGFKEFELLNGDITDLPEQVNVLVISAFNYNYDPTPSSIIGQLFNKGISIEALAKNPLFDLREVNGTWVSKDIRSKKYDYILCVETTEENKKIDAAVKNLFSTLVLMELKGIKIETIAVPLITAGDQNQDYKIVTKGIIEESVNYLEYSKTINKISFVIHNENKAYHFSESMNEILGRNEIILSRGNLSETIRKDIIRVLNQCVNIGFSKKMASELKNTLNGECNAFEFGSVARKGIEYIIQDIYPNKCHDLISKIELLSTKGVARWILSYMHTIRIFGNEAVHYKIKENRKPESIKMEDMEIAMFCFVRVLEFYRIQKDLTQ